ncbi:sulfatase [Postechiella marina]|uniref:Sulfatase n=1 Tax=Postechiella marina TaxID=943941 RepID=A0ABP8CDL8_9FLAO
MINLKFLQFKSLLVIGLVFFSFKKTNSQERPNIVWIVSEDNSKHYLKLFDEKYGVETPNIEALATDGVVFDHAFSNTPVCSAARSTLIASSYGPRLVTHYHRNLKQVPLPNGVEMFPAYLKRTGYYTTNNSKEDYNLFKADNVWDDSSKKATWRDRKKGQPFFHVFNIGTTHESRLHFTQDDVKVPTKANQASMAIFPVHPQTDLFRYTNARYHDKMQEMDGQLGEVVAQLKEDGLYENTIIFYYGDHGGVLPGSKGYIKETGVHVPLVVRIPEKYKNLSPVAAGTRTNAFVSFVDFGATVLNLAGVEIPKGIDGQPFLGKNISKKQLDKRDETFSYTNRMDEKYDMVRAVRKGKYKYVRNYEPFNFDGLMNNYRYKQLGYQQWIEMYKNNKLNAVQSQFFEPKAVEALYNVEEDPFETNNLAGKLEYKNTLKSLRCNLNKRIKSMPDLSFYPEFYLINNAFNNPVAYGQLHKKDISRYSKIANYALLDFDKVKSKLEKSLNSQDTWDRYWALIASSSFGAKAKELAPTIKNISNTDSELVNRVRAAEFLGLTGSANPVSVMTEALYTCKDGPQALLILNSIVLMQDCEKHYNFNINESKINKIVLDEPQVLRRLLYLNSK